MLLLLLLLLTRAGSGLESSAEARVDVVNEIGPPTSMGESADMEGVGLSSDCCENLHKKYHFAVLQPFHRRDIQILTSNQETAFLHYWNRIASSNAAEWSNAVCPVPSPFLGSAVVHWNYAYRHHLGHQ